jgi:hypothetical protein
VDAPELGEDVQIKVRELTSEEHDEYKQGQMDIRQVGNSITATPNLRNATAKLAHKCMIDEYGSPLYAANELAAVSGLSADLLTRVSKKIEDLSGITARAKELTLKNSAAAQTDASPSS